MLPTKWYLKFDKTNNTYNLSREFHLMSCQIRGGGWICGDMCPLFEIISTMYAVRSDIDALNETYDNGIRVILHCGSGNAEYKIESIKGE